ncbi:hypothetical protein MUK42_29123 [Musa troglodytarum]|uniref:Uncharacterized protein n=1 Tax=Musa troglodytarum TaxID=320322 RepID=A0A9E7FKB5_9LILI|nr:hypothetical protein MUK42_29123 [Musa troglodytarum]
MRVCARAILNTSSMGFMVVAFGIHPMALKMSWNSFWRCDCFDICAVGALIQEGRREKRARIWRFSSAITRRRTPKAPTTGSGKESDVIARRRYPLLLPVLLPFEMSSRSIVCSIRMDGGQISMEDKEEWRFLLRLGV